MAKIKKKTFFHYTGKVHDLTVENSHTYNIEGKAVHNSAAGSLVAYVLGITNVDPIEHGLLFSRFLSTERTEPPDIDSDVADRDALIELLKDNFGDDAVVPISNYNTFKLKSLVKDISKFYGIEFDEVNRALAPVDSDVRNAVMKPGDSKDTFVLTYEDSYEHSKSFRDFIDKHPQVAEPIQILFKQNRSLGKHAGGVIVSEKISENMPLIKTKGELQTPWIEGMTYKHLEPMGWIKFDLLGLETLRIIHRCIELIIKRDRGVERVPFDQIREWFEENLDPSRLDLDDPAVYEKVYRGGNFAGVFQLASKGARRLFMQGKPEKMIDIATLTSVFRPGPLAANVHNIYIEAKNNPDKINYGHPLIEKVLGPTYNCLVGDTVVTTEMGDYKIKDIVDRQMIGVSLPSLNEETGEMEEDTIVAAVCNGRRETIEIEIEDGRALRLTPDHRVYTTRGWVEAGALTVEDEIVGLPSEQT